VREQVPQRDRALRLVEINIASTSCIAAVAVIALVIDAMRKIESGAIGVATSGPMRPRAPW
jgi:hypothetical protein